MAESTDKLRGETQLTEELCELRQESLSHSSVIIHVVVIAGFCNCELSTVYYEPRNLWIMF